MKIAVIYRPRNAPPPEIMPGLLDGTRQWHDRYASRFEQLYFFTNGGGFGVADVDDSAELMRMSAEHPFTPFSDVEIRPVLAAPDALGTLQEAFAARSTA